MRSWHKILRHARREKSETETDSLTRVFCTFHRLLINTVALARCADALGIRELLPAGSSGARRALLDRIFSSIVILARHTGKRVAGHNLPGDLAKNLVQLLVQNVELTLDQLR